MYACFFIVLSGNIYINVRIRLGGSKFLQEIKIHVSSSYPDG